MPKESYLEKLIKKLDSNDSGNIQAWVLRLSKEKGFLDTVFNTIHEGIIIIDRHLHIRYANKAAQQLIGLPEETQNLRISQFLRDIDWKMILQKDEDEWYRVSRQEIEVFYPNRRFLHFYIVPHEGSKGEATVILHDVSENRKKNIDRIESEKLHSLSLLAAGVAHEIGNPLNSISLHMQLLRKQLKNKDFNREEAQKLVEVAESEIERLDTVISHFLSAVRPNNPELTPQNIKEIIISALKFMREEIENRSVKVKCSWPDLLPNINGDVNQLKQAFYNILKNSLKAMPEGGTIDINCEYNDDFVIINFTDTGHGITSDQISNIFDPYFSTREDGSGLGLMIVERIIREHAGDISISSEPDKGTVFSIKFPRMGKRTRLLPASASQDD